jgi:hypothetical protein
VGRDLKFVIASKPRGVIEMNSIFPQRLARTEGKRAAVPANDGVGQPRTGGFQVALHADVELQLRRQSGRIHDGGPERFIVAAPCGGHVRIAGPMAAPAIDPLREVARKDRIAAKPVRTFRNRRISGVARDALVRDFAAEVLVVGVVVAGVHRPTATAFGIPSQRQFIETAVGGLVEECAGVIAGTYHEVDLALEDVDLLAGGPDLVASLEEAAAAFPQLIVSIGGLMVELLTVAETGGHCRRRGAIEGAGHAGGQKLLRDIGVARGASAAAGLAAGANGHGCGGTAQLLHEGVERKADGRNGNQSSHEPATGRHRQNSSTPRPKLRRNE